MHELGANKALEDCCTSGCAERNSCRSRIMAAANTPVARAQVNKPRDLIERQLFQECIHK